MSHPYPRKVVLSSKERTTCQQCTEETTEDSQSVLSQWIGRSDRRANSAPGAPCGTLRLVLLLRSLAVLCKFNQPSDSQDAERDRLAQSHRIRSVDIIRRLVRHRLEDT